MSSPQAWRGKIAGLTDGDAALGGEGRAGASYGAYELVWWW